MPTSPLAQDPTEAAVLVVVELRKLDLTTRPWEKHGETMGKPWETMGKTWETHGKLVVEWDNNGMYPLVIEHNYGKSSFRMGKLTINGQFQELC